LAPSIPAIDFAVINNTIIIFRLSPSRFKEVANGTAFGYNRRAQDARGNPFHFKLDYQQTAAMSKSGQLKKVKAIDRQDGGCILRSAPEPAGKQPG
jgi:hypothetical protein